MKRGLKRGIFVRCARLSDCYGRLKSKAVLGLLTARGAAIEISTVEIRLRFKVEKTMLARKLIFNG